ncbi:malonyl-ACP O-methyltransferase BioC [Vibrio sp. JC009]|uniref:malonyl-ACP O-methyltransferase BioC n=1 Tax=Vibrio sp. JC009 TaxID=2912314 RepID=UPI0023B13F00|nr:malonyl-ACP O-methyltransferase BioC [Vibrio sp. JC009]WED22721.1 malonyl-ACP O-methyltransferase BioC [Vibrio sp. JC009]
MEFNRKAAIAEAFGKAASKYDQHAEFQRQVGRELMAKMPRDLTGYKVLDIGCGTGYFSELLAQRGAEVTAADLSADMLEQAKFRCGSSVAHYQQADAENLPFGDSVFDFAFSSLALQWCEDLSKPLKELKRVTKPGGSVLFSTLLDGSLHELKLSWSKIDTHQHVNDFLTEKEIKIALAQSDIQKHHLDLRSIRMWYSSAFQLMRDLKGIGATHVRGRSHGLMKKRTLLDVENEYQKFKGEEGQLPATYNVCLGAINL